MSKISLNLSFLVLVYPPFILQEKFHKGRRNNFLRGQKQKRTSLLFSPQRASVLLSSIYLVALLLVMTLRISILYGKYEEDIIYYVPTTLGEKTVLTQYFAVSLIDDVLSEKSCNRCMHILQ